MALAACLFTTSASAQGPALTPAQRALVAQAGNAALSPAQRVAVAAQIKAAIEANPDLASAFTAAAAALPPAARARASATVGSGLGQALATLVASGRTTDADTVKATISANPAVQTGAGSALAVAAAEYVKAGNTQAATDVTTAVASLSAGANQVKISYGATLGTEYNNLDANSASAVAAMMKTVTDTVVKTAYTVNGGGLGATAGKSVDDRSTSPAGSS